jgi:hypothetical protein
MSTARDEVIRRSRLSPGRPEYERFTAALDAYRSEVLRDAAEELRVEHRRIFWATKPDTCPEAEFLDRMADER